MKKSRAILVPIALAFGCQSSTSAEEIICPTAFSPSVTVVVVDAQSAARSPFANVTVVVRNGTYKDSAFFSAITEENVQLGRAGIGLALGHPGTFDVTVRTYGYEEWRSSNFVTVNNLKCGAASDTIVARVKRTSVAAN